MSGPALRWDDLKEIHKTQAGVYTRGGRVTSILMSRGVWGDTATRDEIRYGIAVSTSRAILRALDSALSEGYTFKVFYKHAPNAWEDYGLFKAVSVEKGNIPGDAELLYYNLVRVSM